MTVQHEMNDLLDNIKKELPERAHEIYEDAVRRAVQKGRSGRRGFVRQMLRHDPLLREVRRRQQQQEGLLAIFAFLIGLLGGAALMYLFDPERGAARRAFLRDQANQMAESASESMEATATRLQNEAKTQVNQAADSLESASKQARSQAKDSVEETEKRVREAVSDTALTAQVQVEIARSLRAPGAVDVSVNDSTVTLSGRILASEAQALVKKIQAMPGVRAVENHLELHDAPESADSEPNNLDADAVPGNAGS